MIQQMKKKRLHFGRLIYSFLRYKLQIYFPVNSKETCMAFHTLAEDHSSLSYKKNNSKKAQLVWFMLSNLRTKQRCIAHRTCVMFQHLQSRPSSFQGNKLPWLLVSLSMAYYLSHGKAPSQRYPCTYWYLLYHQTCGKAA